MDKETGNFCLSGKSKPFSNKRDSSTYDKKLGSVGRDETGVIFTRQEIGKLLPILCSHWLKLALSSFMTIGRDIFSKFKQTKADPELKEQRPRTAIKKVPTKTSNQSQQRPTSATSNSMAQNTKSRFKFPSLKSTQSIDSAMGSQLSSSDEENKTTDEDDEDPGTSSSEEESSEDSGIIKVRVISRSTNDDAASECSRTDSHSPSAKPILVKEFNRTPEMNENDETVNDIDACDDFTESEDEESKAELNPDLITSKIINEAFDDVIDEHVNVKDVVLMEIGPEEKSEIITSLQTYENTLQKKLDNDIIVDDIEANEEIIEQNIGLDTIANDLGQEENVKSATEKLNHENSHNWNGTNMTGNKPYDPLIYDQPVHTNQQNSSLMELVKTSEIKQSNSYENLIQSTILKLEKEEVVIKDKVSNGSENVENVEQTESYQDRLTSEAELQRRFFEDYWEGPLILDP